MAAQAASARPRRREQERDYRQPPAPLRSRGEVCVVDGYGVHVAVNRGRLCVSDGAGRDRRERSYSQLDLKLARLVVLGSAGTISLTGLRWLSDLGVGFLHLDRDGRLLATSTPGSAEARLRRAQALALTNSAGLEIARTLLRQKLEGQQQVLAQLPATPAAGEAFAAAQTALERAGSLDELVMAERDGAFAYWSAWGPVELRFRRSDLAQLPESWRAFGQRSSPLTSGPRLAVNPANALLNYLYALLEAEAQLACLAVGLDPVLGIVHADYRSRASLALDLMEPVRPQVDAYLLELLAKRGFRAGDFYENRKGVCRLLAPLTHTLAQTIPSWAKLIAPVAEQVAAMLADAPGARIERLTTPLTGANRSRGREALRRQPKAQAKPARAPLPQTCRSCGDPVTSGERVYCDRCLPAVQAEQFARFDGSGLRALQRLKAEGHDPSHADAATEKRARATAERKRQAREWEQRYGKLVDLSAFQQEILPLIQEVPLSRLVKATGLSLRYVSQIRRGEKTPHPRHWRALRQASTGPESSNVDRAPRPYSS